MCRSIYYHMNALEEEGQRFPPVLSLHSCFRVFFFPCDAEREPNKVPRFKSPHIALFSAAEPHVVVRWEDKTQSSQAITLGSILGIRANSKSHHLSTYSRCATKIIIW